jgi:hypothetical protein
MYGQNYTWSELYNFPIWLRKFTYRKIIEHYKNLNKETETVSEENLDQFVKSNKTTPQKPDISVKRNK